MLQDFKVLDLKEISAIAVYQQFQDSIPQEWYLAKGCEDCRRGVSELYEYKQQIMDRPYETWVCLVCNFTPWLKNQRLPKELENYCVNLLRNKKLYIYEILREGEESRLGEEWEISEEEGETGDDKSNGFVEWETGENESNGSEQWEAGDEREEQSAD